MSQNSYDAAAKYGRALFEQAKETNELDQIHEEVLELGKVFESVPELAHALTDTRLDYQQKGIVFSQLTEKASPMMKSFLNIIFENRRMDIMSFIVEDFIKRYNDHQGIIKGLVTSAVPLSDGQKEKIGHLVAEKFGFDQIEFDEKVDESIVGGVIVEAQNRIIDGSVKTQMTKLRQLLAKV